jgi:hypothetical protein
MTDDHTHRGDDVHSVEAAELEANGGWQPIETAPKDGTMVDLFASIEDCSGRAPNYYWSGKIRAWRYMHGGEIAPHHVTHWMPLPAAPTEGE